MNILSLFSGIGGFELAIERVFGKENISCIGFSEIERIAIGIYRHHWPDHPQLGDVRNVTAIDRPTDLLVAGFPCTDLSSINQRGKGLEGKKSGLFFEALRVLNLVKPKWWVFENVDSMKPCDKDIISGYLGVSPVMIDAASVSCQRRKRLFWANFKITALPEHSAHKFVDVLLPKDDPTLSDYIHTPQAMAWMDKDLTPGKSRWDSISHYDTSDIKCPTIMTGMYTGYPYNVLVDRRFGTEGLVRKLTPVEVERIMGFPDNWTLMDRLWEPVPHGGRYKALGNAVSVPVIEHIMSCLRCIIDNQKQEPTTQDQGLSLN